MEEVITDDCGEVVDDDDALVCVAEETIEAIDNVTLAVFFVDSALLSTILKNISNSLSSFLLLVSSILLRTSSSFSKTVAFMTNWLILSSCLLSLTELEMIGGGKCGDDSGKNCGGGGGGGSGCSGCGFGTGGRTTALNNPLV